MSLYFAGFISMVENQILNTIIRQFRGESDLSLALSYKEREPEYICYLMQLSDSPFRAKKAKHPLASPMEQKAKHPLVSPVQKKRSILWLPPFEGGREGDLKGDGRGIKKGDGRGIKKGDGRGIKKGAGGLGFSTLPTQSFNSQVGLSF